MTRLSAPCPVRPVLVAVILLVIAVRPAHAYINPGAGGMLMQLLIGGLISGVVLLRVGWRRFRDGLRGRAARRKDDEA